jgi:hypothetical protein
MQQESGPTSEPSDNTTLMEVLDGYRTAGFAIDIFAEDGATVRCGSCDSVMAAAKLTMHSVRRLEGASDPADMMAVIATSCPVCASQGTMVLAYGTNASPEEGEVWLALSDKRGERDLPAGSSPDEENTEKTQTKN